MSRLHFEEARTEEQFAALSLIHALGWRTTYAGAIPADFMAREITDDHWVPYFRENYQLGRARGLLLCREDVPVACLNYGRARTENFSAGVKEGSDFPNGAYADWGEIISFYTDPACTGRGYGSVLMEEALRRLRADGYLNCYVFVLRENEGARRFYARHGFAWDGTEEHIPFPHDMTCVDLRYTKQL